MDKGKNRNDLLAAGRKKLQQYRKKKDNKGSNNNSGNNSNSSKGKSSNKNTTVETASAASSEQLDPNLASGNEVGEELREDSEGLSVNRDATDQQVAETEAVLVSSDQVEASGSTSQNDTLEDKSNQEDADPSHDKETSYSGSENPIHEEKREKLFTAPAEEREDADKERTGEDCSGNGTSTTESLQHELNPDNATPKICKEHPISIEEESGACINPKTEFPAKGKDVEESLETIKRELYLMGLSRDLLQSKLDEQTASSTELLSELMHCKSKLLDAINEKEKANLQLARAVEEIDLCNMKCEKLETDLEMSKDKLEIAVSQLGALQSENTSIKQESEKLESMREILSRENNELSTQLLAQKERLVQLESSIKEAGTYVERLVEENVLLSSSFNLQRSILVEADESSANLPSSPLTSQNNSLLNVRIEESEGILRNLRSSIESMRGRSVTFNKSGGIANLIKAFESQATQVGTVVSDEVVSAESSEVPYDITVQFVVSLENALNQMKLDLVNTDDQHEGEKAGENPEDHAAIKEKIDGLSVFFNTYQDKIDNLQEQFASVQKGADDEAVRLLAQLEELQNEANDKLKKLVSERDGMVSAFSEAILRLNSMGLSIMDKSPDSTDLNPNLLTLIDFAVHSIESLQMENHMLQNRNEISCGLVKKMHDKLQNVINYSEDGAGEIMSNIENLELISNSYEGLIKRVQELVDGRAILLSMKNKMETALAHKSKEAEEFSVKCKSLSENLNDFCLIKGDLESILWDKSLILEEMYVRCHALANKMQENEVADAATGDREKELLNSILPQLESSVALYLERHDQELAQIDLSKNYLYEANIMPDISPENWTLPLHLLLSSHVLPKLSEMRERMDLLDGSNIEQQTEIQVLRDSLKEMKASISQCQLELNHKTSELEQSEQRLSSVKEKLGIAVSKGKGLIVQRDSLKQSLQEKSNELERCIQRLTEAEDKLKSYGEADRIEALESELSYIRNSYNVLRDSFLIKDSVVQRIEGVLEDLDFPEEFHARDIAEQVEVLSRMAVQSENSSSMQVESSVQVELQQDSLDAGGDEMRIRYAALERKFCELAEHNNMLEQSLLERNEIITKWDEILADISIIPPHFRDADPEERIDWLVNMLSDTQRERDVLQLKIESLEESSEMLIFDLEGSRKRISELNAELAAVRSEKEFFSDSLDKLRFDYEVERENMRKQLSGLREKISEKIEVENEICTLVDLVRKAFPNSDSYEELSGGSSVKILGKLVSNLLETINVGRSMSVELVDLDASEKNKSLIEEVHKLKEDMTHLSEKYQEVVGEHESAVRQRDSLLQQLQGLEEINMRFTLLEEERNTLQVELLQLQEKQLREVEALNRRISFLESELELTAGQRNTLQEQFNDLHQLQDKHVQEAERLEELNRRIRVLEEEKAHSSKKNQELVAELEFMVEERNTLQVELQQLQEKQLQEVEALNGRISFLESELELTAGQRNNLQEQLNDLHQLQDKHVQEAEGLEELNRRISVLEEDKAHSSKKHQELVAEMEFMAEERNTLQVELQQLQEKQLQEVGRLNVRISFLESELELTAGQRNNLQEQLNDLHQLQDKHVQEAEGLEELNRRISVLEEDKAHSSKKHQELVAEMEFMAEERYTLQVELQQLQEKQLQEVGRLNVRISFLESELELTVGQRNTLQEQLNDLQQLQEKHVKEVEFLNGKIILLEEEKAHEPDKHQQLVSELESTEKERNVLQEQFNQVRDKLNMAVRKGKGLVQQRDSLKQQIETLEAEKSSLLTRMEENIQLLNRISAVLHTVNPGSFDPIQKVEWILKLNADLKMTVDSAEAEANKSRRATELLLAELNESQERNDILQEELESLRNNQVEGLREMGLAVGKLRDISFEILEGIVGKLHKDVGIMSYMEEFVSSMANGIDIVGDSSGYTSSVSSLEEDVSIRKRNHANHYLFGPKPDEWDENIMTHVHACVQELCDLKISADNVASVVDQKGTHLLRSMSFAKNELDSLKSDVNKLRKEMREKEEENSLLRSNLSLLYESCSSSIDEVEADCTNQRECDLHATPLLNEAHIRSLADRLVGAVRSEGRTKELKSTIMELQMELQDKDLRVSQISSELSSQIRGGEEKIRELGKQVDAIGNDKATLQLRVSQLQEVEFSSIQLHERVSYYADMLAKKEQEIESLMQALDEEEKEMEEMEIKNKQLQSLLQEKEISLKSLEASNSKVLKKLSTTTAKFDELHHLSENLIVEVENLQLQLEDRDSEISFLRQEVTRVTSELLSSDETYKRYVVHLQDFAKWVQTLVLRFGLSCNESDELDYDKMKEYTEALDSKLGSVVAELDELRIGMQSRDELLQIERGKVADLVRKCEGLESSLRERSICASTSGVLEIEQVRETVMNVRGGRKGSNANNSNNSDQVAIAIDQDAHDQPLDEDDDKAHGFKPLTMSRFVPRFTRRLADRVDGMWVSGDRLLMRQPILRIGVLIYWIVLHAMLASSI